MTTLATSTPIPRLAIIDGHATTTSLQVAEYFGRRHDNVLQSIRDLIEQTTELGCLLNFQDTSVDVLQPNGGVRQASAYRMDKDAFTLLAMGFTGKKALQFKLAYITAFNQMEARLARPAPDALAHAATALERTAKALRTAGIPKGQALAQALSLVHQQTGLDLLPDYTPAKPKEPDAATYVANLVRRCLHLKSSKHKLYDDGLVSHSEVLRLSHKPAHHFAKLVDQAIKAGSIQRASTTGFGGIAYTLNGGAA